MEEKQILRIQMEQVISDLYQKMEDEYIKYRNRTEEKLVRYQELRAKDEISSKEVKYQVMRINMLSVRFVSSIIDRDSVGFSSSVKSKEILVCSNK